MDPPTGFSPPHSCSYCDRFIIYLHELPGKTHIDTPVFKSPNPSQIKIAERLFGFTTTGNDTSIEHRELYQITDGISFFEADLVDLIRYSNLGCVFSKHILRCLLKDDFCPKNFALGTKIITSYSLEFGILDLDNGSWEILLGDEEDACADNTYSMLAVEDDPAATVIENRPINLHPGSVIVLDQAREWLDSCSTHHDACRPLSPDFVPTRLLHISKEGGKFKCVLEATQSHKPRSYAALSYCWGGDQPFKLTLKTINSYMEQIDQTKLPQGLQDAIFVTWKLGLDYLWIDALCIIQDSPEDKSNEIGQMSTVYGNATVTIAATKSQTVWEGFLGTRTVLGAELPDMVFELSCQMGEVPGKVVLIPITFEPRDPLDSRAWTFQERVLSNRVLDFGSLRTQLSCRTETNSVRSDGWSRQANHTVYGSSELDSQVISDLITAKYDEQSMLQFWMRTVEGFTNRTLTFSSDKLPAIAGLAERFGNIMRTDYFAGLWRASMPASLMWISVKPEARPKSTSAPSWSWAAIPGAVRFDTRYTDDKGMQFDLEAQDHDVGVTLLNKLSPYGAVKAGRLAICSYVQSARWLQRSKLGTMNVLNATDSGIPVHPEGLVLGFTMGESCGITIMPDALESEFLEDPTSGIDVRLALVGIVYRPKKVVFTLRYSA